MPSEASARSPHPTPPIPRSPEHRGRPLAQSRPIQREEHPGQIGFRAVGMVDEDPRIVVDPELAERLLEALGLGQLAREAGRLLGVSVEV